MMKNLDFKIKVTDAEVKNEIIDICDKFKNRSLELNTFQYERNVTEFKKVLDKFKNERLE